MSGSPLRSTTRNMQTDSDGSLRPTRRTLPALAGGDAVTFLVSHFLVGGSKVHGHGAPRGERELHMGEAYAATPEAIPPGPQYVALGHIHAPQRVPGARVPAEYAGSLLELDFGEAGEDKRVVIVDVEPGLPAVVSLRSDPRGPEVASTERGVGQHSGYRRCVRVLSGHCGRHRWS